MVAAIANISKRGSEKVDFEEDRDKNIHKDHMEGSNYHSYYGTNELHHEHRWSQHEDTHAQYNQMSASGHPWCGDQVQAEEERELWWSTSWNENVSYDLVNNNYISNTNNDSGTVSGGSGNHYCGEQDTHCRECNVYYNACNHWSSTSYYAATNEVVGNPNSSSAPSVYTELTSSLPNTSSSETSSLSLRLTRDDVRAAQHCLPFPISDMIEWPMDKFNDVLAASSLTDEQVSLCRDIRRRGKNKIAAAKCRRRKLTHRLELRQFISHTEHRKLKSLHLRAALSSQLLDWQSRVASIKAEVLKNLGCDDVTKFDLRVTEGNCVKIVNTSHTS